MSKVPWQSRIITFLADERERLVRYVRRHINDAAERDGEDIVQDVILSVFSTADITIPIENLSAYVYRSLRNRIVDYLRKKRDIVSFDAENSENGDLTLADILPDPHFDSGRVDLRLDIRQRLFRALEVLNDEQRAVVIATELEGRTFQELSEEWSVPLGTLLARKSRALRRIRKAFPDFGQS